MDVLNATEPLAVFKRRFRIHREVLVMMLDILSLDTKNPKS